MVLYIGPFFASSADDDMPGRFKRVRQTQMSIMVMSSALPQPAINRNQPSFHVPIFLRELVKCSSGNMANGSCSASTTWLSVSRSFTLLSPRMPMMRTAGMMASVRVMSRRSHGLIRQCMKPSITTCPASVPVMVLLCPLASRATTNNALASGGAQQAAPASGRRCESSRCRR
jgi:hypothetical protein